MTQFDVAVVGAGIVGTWTALHLKKLGKNVLLLEQFPCPHTRGSSHGPSRLIRSAYAETHFAQLMPDSQAMWKEAENEADTKLLHRCGALCVAQGPEDEDEYRHSLANMAVYARDGVELDGSRFEHLFGKTLRYGDQRKVFLDKTGGVLLAHKALLALQGLFRASGGHLWDECPVTSLEPRGESGVSLRTPRGEVLVSSVVVCAGTWTQRLLSSSLGVQLPLQPQVVRVYYWREKEAGAHSMAAGFPALLDLGKACVYALPALEYPGLVKVCLHGGVDCDPDRRDQTPADPRQVAQLTEYVREHFPLLELEPAIVETCMYTVTPDECFIIDTVPGHKNIVVGAGFSGTGFKTSPAVGRLLGELAIGQEPHLDISAFRIDRFDKK